MQTVILVIHLLLALAIIVLVLIQRSSGGGLGIGGSGGGLGDFANARTTANALTKATTFCAFAFFGTSLLLAILGGQGRQNPGILDDYVPAASAPAVPGTVNADGTKPSTDPAAVSPVAPAPGTDAAAPAEKAAPATPQAPVSTE